MIFTERLVGLDRAVGAEPEEHGLHLAVGVGVRNPWSTSRLRWVTSS